MVHQHGPPALRFVSQRPRYASGMAVADFPAIQSVLYADADFEAYLLDRANRRDTLLLIVRRPGEGGNPSLELLRHWHAGHGVDELACVADSSDAFELVVATIGAWMAHIPAAPLDERELYALLFSLIRTAVEAADNGLAAAMMRALLWSDGPPRSVRLNSIYVRLDAVNEQRVVHDLAQTFLWAAAGITSPRSRADSRRGQAARLVPECRPQLVSPDRALPRSGTADHRAG